MICPQCKVEYRPGFRRCADCGVDLIYELPREALSAHVEEQRETTAPPEYVEGEEFRSLVEYEESLACAGACIRLKEAGIKYRVTELPRNLGYQMEPRPEFQLAVPASQWERAKKMLGIQIAHGEEADFPDNEEILKVMELATHDDLPATEIRGEREPENWHPEDATVEVWSGDRNEHGLTLDLSLKENYIHFRAQELRDGELRIFVMPEDETRAREIVREIVEGAPPE